MKLYSIIVFIVLLGCVAEEKVAIEEPSGAEFSEQIVIQDSVQIRLMDADGNPVDSDGNIVEQK